jgi:hypothetical protein
VPLIIGVGAYLGLWTWSETLSASVNADDPADVGLAVASLALLLLALIIPFVALIFFIVGIVRAVGDWRRDRRHATGRYNRAELADRAQQEQFAAAWRSSTHLRGALIRRELPPQIRVWDVVPHQGEAFFSDTAASYARFYGQDTTYATSGGFFFGYPLFVAAGVALSAAGNAARRSAAEATAREQWREHQGVRLVVSNQRLICNVNGQWLSFYYADMTAVYPEVDHWALVCQFGSTAPLLLQGLGVPSAALITVLMTYGPDAVAEHPSLARLAH